MRRSILVLSILALLTALAIAAVWTRTVPQYLARAEVRVRRVVPYLVFRTEDNGPIPFDESFKNTQMSVMKSASVLRRVLDQPEIRQTGWYKNPPRLLLQRLAKDPTPRIERLKESLSVASQKGTEMIEVTFADRSGEDARVILNTLLDQYVIYIEEMSNATELRLNAQLTKQRRILESEILGRESAIDRLRASLGTVTPQELISQKRVHLDEMQAHLSELGRRIAMLEWELEQAGAVDSNDVEGSPTTKTERRLSRTRYKKQLLTAEVAKQRAEFERLFQDAQSLEKQNAALLRERELFDAVRRRLDQKAMERNAPGAISILSRATVPSESHKDRRILFTAIALGLYLVVGSGIIFLR
jgi:uncharacterized protein involved in exopolysaccharide biosynthesis